MIILFDNQIYVEPMLHMCVRSLATLFGENIIEGTFVLFFGCFINKVVYKMNLNALQCLTGKADNNNNLAISIKVNIVHMCGLPLLLAEDLANYVTNFGQLIDWLFK